MTRAPCFRRNDGIIWTVLNVPFVFVRRPSDVGFFFVCNILSSYLSVCFRFRAVLSIVVCVQGSAAKHCFAPRITLFALFRNERSFGGRLAHRMLGNTKYGADRRIGRKADNTDGTLVKDIERVRSSRPLWSEPLNRGTSRTSSACSSKIVYLSQTYFSSTALISSIWLRYSAVPTVRTSWVRCNV